MHARARSLWLVAVARKPNYHVWTVAVPLALIALMSFGQFSLPLDDDGTSDRMQNTATALLTATAYRTAITTSLPDHLGYLTLMDRFLIACPALLCLNAIETPIALRLGEDLPWTHPQQMDHILLAGLAAIWLLTFSYFAIKARMAFNDARLELGRDRAHIRDIGNATVAKSAACKATVAAQRDIERVRSRRESLKARVQSGTNFFAAGAALGAKPTEKPV